MRKRTLTKRCVSAGPCCTSAVSSTPSRCSVVVRRIERATQRRPGSSGPRTALRQATGYAYRSPTAEQEVTRADSAVASALGADERDRARAEGAALSLEDACDYAARGRGERKRPATGWAALTATEARVAALAAEGLTNAQVGEQLFISRHTVDSHLRHIYAKLGVSTRAELATRVAREDGAGA